MISDIKERMRTLELRDDHSGIRYYTAEIARLKWVIETIKGCDATIQLLEEFVDRACRIIENRLKYDLAHGIEHHDGAVALIETCECLGLYEQEGL